MWRRWYGHEDQLSVQVSRFDEDVIRELLGLSERFQRRLLIVCHAPECDTQSLSERFANAVTFEAVSLNAHWRVFVEATRTATNDP